MKRHLGTWLPAYLAQALRPRPLPTDRPLTLFLAVVDHFEPYWAGADEGTALSRLGAWEAGLPAVCADVADERGRPPQHTFFYPLEDYRPGVMDRLAALCARGLGEVEVHLHHQGETPAQLEDMLASYAETLHQRHGLLHRDPVSGRPAYAFIHGNWALDNSLPDGSWCGVNDEISILARTGCYADFTLPSYPSPAQTRTVNAIYYATDDPDRPKSHDRGRPAAVGHGPGGDLLMVQGVLALDWGRRKAGVLPKVENSDLSWSRPLDLARMDLWLRFAPALAGADHVRFLKLSCHGAPEPNQAALLGEPARRFFRGLGDWCRQRGVHLRFVNCWEMVQAIHALERGEELS